MRPIYRVSRPGPLWWSVTKTAVQTAAFWTLFLWLIPEVIVSGEHRLELSGFEGSAAGWVVFAGGGSIGLWSGWAMAVRGRGTPFPTDAARELVIAGPYRWIRNPMAAGGIAQGVGVGIALGSWWVILYALCGAAAWHWGIRPSEERDLESRFGVRYEHYRSATPCWRARLTPYREAEAGYASVRSMRR